LCSELWIPCRNSLKYLWWGIMFQGIPLVVYRYHPLLTVIIHFCTVESPWHRSYPDYTGVIHIMTV
jgi:lipopolysaccharide biosynthesis glycosyltransferase